MLKKFQLIFLFTLFLSASAFAQEVVLSDEFDNGDSKWSGGWIDAATTTVTTSIDNTSKLSGVNSYKLVVTKGSADTYRIQRNANLPLESGYEYTVSFMAVASKAGSINVLFELTGDPYTKALNETANVTTTAQTFTYKMVPDAAIPTNQLKLHFGGTANDGVTFWVDKIIVTRAADPYLISKWGSTPRGAVWPILNTATTPAGSASMGATPKITGWATIRGTFADPITPTTTKALVVTGTLEFDGSAGSAYTWLRYAVMGDDAPVLANANTPTAAWTPGTNAAGYQFDPVSGTGDVSNGSGGGTGASGTLWLVKNNNWNSTNTNGGGPLGPTVRQAPYRAIADKGVYNWAISIQPLADGSNEIRYYFEKQHAADKATTYWFGGTVIDPTPVRKTFNYVAFGANSEAEATTFLNIKLANVRASLGAPITVTDAPFQSFYVNQWGSTPRGNNWPILNDANTLDGDGVMGAAGKPTAWASIRGGFRQDVTPTLKKALVITGTYEMVGGGAGSAYTWLRYALTYQDSCTLVDQNKPTANWTSKKNAFGYQFTPRTGTGELANGGGGSGVVWTVNNSAAWNSTYSNNGGPLVTVQQAPARAVASAGVYDWAISVQPLADGTNEIRWYFIKKAAAGKQTEYWFGGSCIDKTPVATKFNGINFSVNNDVDATCKQVNIANVQVNLADPITVPEAPWQAYYVDKFAFIADNTGGWKYTPGEVTGNASISGSANLVNNAQLSAGFADAHAVKTDKAFLVTGKFELVGGGFEDYNSLALGLMYNSNMTQNLDQTGYVFFPHSDNNPSKPFGLTDMATVGAVIANPWLATSGTGPKVANENYVLSNKYQQPGGSIGTAGTYNFSLSVQKVATGTEVRYLIEKSDKKYSIGGILQDTKSPAKITKFNTLNFMISNAKTSALNIADLMLDYGTALTVPTQFLKLVDVTADRELPAEYKLSQNYPNPFNPTTSIEFSLPQTGKVSLVVYDMLGKEVAELVNKDLNAGYHKVSFDASNLATGVYVYRLTAGNFVSAKKLILMK